MRDVDHEVAQDLDVALFRADPDVRDRSVLDLIRHLFGHGLAGCTEDISGRLIDNVFRQDSVLDAVPEGELLIELISSDLREIISAGVKEH